MTITSKTYHRIGEHAFAVIVGGEDANGYSIDLESSIHPTREAAQKWAAERFAAGVGFYANLYESVWELNEYTDHVYGHILDADAIEKNYQYGWLKDDRSVEWDPAEPA